MHRRQNGGGPAAARTASTRDLRRPPEVGSAASALLLLQRQVGNQALGKLIGKAGPSRGVGDLKPRYEPTATPGDDARSRAAAKAILLARKRALMAYGAKRATARELVEAYGRIAQAERDLGRYREAIGAPEADVGGGGLAGVLAGSNPAGLLVAAGLLVMAAHTATAPVPGRVAPRPVADALDGSIGQLTAPIARVLPRVTDLTKVEARPVPRRRDGCGDPRTLCAAPSVLLGAEVATVWGEIAEKFIALDFCNSLGRRCVEGGDAYIDNSRSADLLTIGLVAHNPAVKPREPALKLQVRNQSRPDLLTFTSPKEYYEIKPLSGSGVRAGVGKKLPEIATLMTAFALPYRPGTAYNPKRTIPVTSMTINGCPFEVGVLPVLATPGLLLYRACVTGSWTALGPTAAVSFARILKTAAQAVR